MKIPKKVESYISNNLDDEFRAKATKLAEALIDFGYDQTTIVPIVIDKIRKLKIKKMMLNLTQS